MNTPNSIEVSTMSAQFAPSPADERSSDPMECIEGKFQNGLSAIFQRMNPVENSARENSGRETHRTRP